MLGNEKAVCRDCGYPKSESFEHVNCCEYKDGKPSHYEMTFEEIGERLGISRQYCEQIFNRAISKMRRAFKREGITADVLSLRDASVVKGDNVAT